MRIDGSRQNLGVLGIVVKSVRAGMAEVLESSDYMSIQLKIRHTVRKIEPGKA